MGGAVKSIAGAGGGLGGAAVGGMFGGGPGALAGGLYGQGVDRNGEPIRKMVDMSGRPADYVYTNPLREGSTVAPNPEYQKIQAQLQVERDPAKQAELAASLAKTSPTIVTSTQTLGQEYQMEGPEKYLASMKNKIGQEEISLMDKAAIQNATAQEQARQALASRGGLQSGSAERLAGKGSVAQMMANQASNRAATGARLDLDVQGNALDRENKKYNLENTLKSIGDKNTNAKEKYAADMQAWAAKMQAQAALDAGPTAKGDRGGIMGGIGKITGK